MKTGSLPKPEDHCFFYVSAMNLNSCPFALKTQALPHWTSPSSMGFYVYTSSLLPVVSVLFSEHFIDHKCQVFPFWEAPKKQIQNALSEFSPKFLYWLFRVLFFSRYEIQLKTEWGGTVIPTDQMLSSIKASPG